MFKDRFEAGSLLADKLEKFSGEKEAIVLAIPRGGLQIGYQVSKKLHVPLDIIVTKKIGYPGEPEYAIGSVGPKGEVYLTETGLDIPKDYIKREAEELKKAVQERYRKYRGNKPLPDLKNKIVIIVDDGLATGSTMMAAVEFVRREKPAMVIVAVPVAPEEAVRRFERIADKVVCVDIPDFFQAIGMFYESFPQVEDDEAIRLLREANR